MTVVSCRPDKRECDALAPVLICGQMGICTDGGKKTSGSKRPCMNLEYDKVGKKKREVLSPILPYLQEFSIDALCFFLLPDFAP